MKFFFKSPFIFHITITILLYVPGFLITNAYFEFINEYAIELFSILLVSLVFFSLGWLTYAKKRVNLNTIYDYIPYINFTLVIYIISLLYTFYETPPALLFIGNPDLIAYYREATTKGKIGLDSIINGVYFASSYIALPMLVLIAYYKNHYLKHLILLLSTLSLLLSMEKARAFIIYIPLAIFFIKVNFRKFTLVVIIFYSIILITSNFVGINKEELSDRYSSNIQERAVTGVDKMLFESPNTVEFSINRIFWIPYITAIDWLKYRDYALENTLLLGQTTPILYNILGFDERYRIENLVFKFQFDYPDDSLGSANSHYLLDAYFNWGLLGIVIYSYLFGLILKFLWINIPSPLNYILYNYAYAATIANLHSLFLGAGLLFILIMTILVKYRR